MDPSNPNYYHFHYTSGQNHPADPHHQQESYNDGNSIHGHGGYHDPYASTTAPNPSAYPSYHNFQAPPYPDHNFAYGGPAPASSSASGLAPELDPDLQRPLFAPHHRPVVYSDSHRAPQHDFSYPAHTSNHFYQQQSPLPFEQSPAHYPSHAYPIDHHQQQQGLAPYSVGSSTSLAPSQLSESTQHPTSDQLPQDPEAAEPKNRTHLLPPAFSDSEEEDVKKVTSSSAQHDNNTAKGSTKNPQRSRAATKPKTKKAAVAKDLPDQASVVAALEAAGAQAGNMVATRGAGAAVNYAEQPYPESPPPRRTRTRGAASTAKSEDAAAESDVSRAISDVDEGMPVDVAPKKGRGRKKTATVASPKAKVKKTGPKQGALAIANEDSGSDRYPTRSRGVSTLDAGEGSSGQSSRSRTKTHSAETRETIEPGDGPEDDEGRACQIEDQSETAVSIATHSLDHDAKPPAIRDSTTAAGSSSAPQRRLRSQRREAAEDDQMQRSYDTPEVPSRFFTRTSSGRKVVRPSYNEDSSGHEDEDNDVDTPPLPTSRQQTLRSQAPSARSSLLAHYETSEMKSQSPDPLDAPVQADEYAQPEEPEDSDEDEAPINQRTTRSGRRVKTYREDEDGSDDEVIAPTRSSRRGVTSKSMGDFVVDDDEDEPDGEYGATNKARGRLSRGRTGVAALADKRKSKSGRRGRGNSVLDDDDLEEVADTGEESEGSDDQGGGRSYGLRQRKKVDYSLAAPPASPQRDGFGRVIKRGRGRGGGASDPNGGAFELDAKRAADLGLPSLGGKGKSGWEGMPLSMTGKDYARAFGDDVDSSDDDIPAARKANRPQFSAGGAGGLLGGGPTPLGGAGGAMAGNEGSARDAFGRIKKGGDALADVDPLGVNMQVDFSSVGGLDSHIQQLKEMVSLPLLYPEVFQRFKVTPPRGVLFHGPPGTGKTLVARALAASCSSSGQQISFFMRKGADCLSKWVGEAERQLRMLFDEARASQPSIIFFDEIDGLAPVRSSKQDQIHASIVSTLLALMDGMDGRGQVVVIGATNRPDSVDPALRRPGRFDREFYFPLPSKEGRRSIIDIHTKGWEPPLSDDFKDKLAEVTKGYGGADMRALCTEAALNAIQRRYPQIYQTTERLLLQPETIQVDAKDFMMSVNKIVPSSARSASSAAAPLPEFLKPILGRTVDQAIAALQKVMPPASKRNPLEEALWEDEPVGNPLVAGSLAASASDGGFGREMMLQSFETLRIFRPRLVISGKPGMGQSFVGAALLHHLEGYHVQSLDIGALMGDSARTPEAAVVQLFVEAKRHKPSVVFIPGLIHWAHSVSETVRATTKALLDELSPSDPILLLAIAEGPLTELPHDVARWFGYLRDNKVEAKMPDQTQRHEFFAELLQYVAKPPTEFPDALPRRKRVLEELPKAPPRAPREPTAAELQQQAADDQRTLEHLKYRLGPVLNDLRKKYKKFTRNVWDEYNLTNLTQEFTFWREKGKIVVRLRYGKGFMNAHRRRASSVDESMLRGAVETQEAGPEAETTRMNGEVGAAEDVADSATQSNDQIQPQTNGDDVTMHDGSGPNGPVPTAEVPQPADPTDGSTVAGSSNLAQALPILAVGQDGYSASQPAPAVNGTGMVGSDGQPAGEAPPGGVSADEDHVNFDYRDMPIWTMTLEKMQRHLYYNGYLTLDDFMRDLNKIVDNAEEAREVDTERLVRAHQMRNYAVVLLDQYIDAGFREECQRMAERQLTREREKAKAEAEAKSKALAAAAAPRRPSGERFSARVQGQAPEHSTPVDPLSIERSNGKRSRASSARASGDGGQDGERKRARSALINEVDAAIGNGMQGVVSTTASGGEQAQVQLQVDPSGASQLGGGGSTSLPATNAAPPLQPAAGSALGPIGAPASTAEQVVPVEHPPFNCPRSLLDQLEQKLLSTSSTFSIDQLLQLRAACFDQVWRHRSDWDRLELIADLRALIDDVFEAVSAEREAEREQ